ncbi:MAG: TonB-dependent receptor [Desulfobacterales bacterium]|nr:TonB-dependent receptor [Desulfobacterales bacterium]
MITQKIYSVQQLIRILVVLSFLIQPLQLSAKEDLKPDDLFDLSLEELVKVYIATKTETAVEEAPSIISVITGDEIRNMGARNIIDVLRTVPGFDLSHQGIYPMHMTYIRGITSISSEKLKVMIDGHSIQPFWGEPELHFDRLPVTSIKKIEIIRGPGSALYGTGAFLGVVNIITKQGGDEPSQAGVEGGSFDTARPYAELSYKEGDLKTYIFAEHYQTDGYDGTVGSDMGSAYPYFAPSGSREITDSLKHFTVQSNISYKNIYFSGFFQNADSEIPIGVNAVLTDEDDMDSYYGYGELGYKSPVTDSSSLMIRTYYDYSSMHLLYEVYPEETAALYEGFPSDEGIYAETSGKWSVMGIEISGDYEPRPGFKMVAGASYEHLKQYDVGARANANITGRDSLEVDGVDYPPYEYFPGGLTDISENGNWNRNETRTVRACYLQGTAGLKKLFSLEKKAEILAVTIGARYDDYDDVGYSANPRFGMVYAPSKKLWFKALYGTAFRAPKFTELYYDNTPLKGNPGLKPEEIHTAEFLAGYKFSRIFSASVTGFYITAEDLIKLTKLESEWTYDNAGEMQSHGMEAEFKAVFGKNRYAYLNFTWQDVKDTSHAQIISEGGQVYTQEDFSPGNVPEFYGNIGVSYGFTENIIAGLSLNYVGEKERSEERVWAGDTLTDDSGDPVDDRWLVNASLTFKNFPVRGTEFQISGFNLLDQDHRDPDISGFIENDIPRPRATFYGRISYSF